MNSSLIDCSEFRFLFSPLAIIKSLSKTLKGMATDESAMNVLGRRVTLKAYDESRVALLV